MYINSIFLARQEIILVPRYNTILLYDMSKVVERFFVLEWTLVLNYTLNVFMMY